VEPIIGADQVELPAGAVVRALPRLDLDPDAVGCITLRTREWGRENVEDVLHRHGARALVVLHRGRVAYEWYGFGSTAATRHPCYSITKSFTGTLAAMAVREGVLDRYARVGDLLPELGGSGFADATVAQVADMTVSIGYTEDYAETAPSDGTTLGFGDYLASLGAGGELELRAWLARIPAGPHPHGHAFSYATPKTEVLGWLLERAQGAGYVELLTGLWDGVGAEHAASLGRTAAGVPMLGAGLATTTRDLARAGLMLAERRHVPAPVIASMRAGGDPDAFVRGVTYSYLEGYAYGDQWWLPPGVHRPLSAWGIYGQLLWIDPDAEVVIACHSGGPHASDRRRDLEHDALCRALTEESTTWP
jgi:CubicO group peptidase (beta-lactamase class C family)